MIYKRLAVFVFCFFFLLPIKGFATSHFIVLTSAETELFRNKDGSGRFTPKKNLFGSTFEFISLEGGLYYKIRNDSLGEVYIKRDGNFLKTRTGSLGGYISALTVENSELAKKALIMNKVDKNATVRVSIDFYDEPTCTGKVRGNVSLFEFRYIYDEFKKNNKTHSYLVAKGDRLRKGNAQNNLVGWIKSEHVAEWNSLIGVEFEKTSFRKRKKKYGLAKIFRGEKDLWYSKQHIFKEADTKEPLPYYANRFPLLETREYNGKIYHKTVYIGNAYAYGDHFYTREEVDRQKKKVAEALANQHVQIAILVDATKGMQDHIDIIKSALQSFYQKSRKEISGSVAVAVYRDFPDGPKQQYVVMTDFTRNINQIKNAINKIRIIEQPKDTGPGTFPEAVFNGIYQTIQGFNWSDTALGKYILLIGDHGNHERADQWKHAMDYSTKDLGNMLHKKGIILHALHVNLNETNKQKYIAMFDRQIRAIKAANLGMGAIKKVYRNTVGMTARGLENLISEFKALKTVLAKHRSNENLVASELGKIFKGSFDQKLLKFIGLDPEVFKANQLCDIGFVYKKKGKYRQIAEKVFITKTQLQNVRTQMMLLAEALVFFDHTTPDLLKNTIGELVKTLTGNTIDERSNIAKYIERKSGIPVNTPWLQKNLNDFMEDMMDEKNRYEFNKYLREKLIALEEISTEQKITYDPSIDWDEEYQHYRYRKVNGIEGRIPYFFDFELPIPKRKGTAGESDARKRHAWIPLNALP